MSFWSSEVRIWRVNSYDAEDPSDALSHRLVAKIELQVRLLSSRNVYNAYFIGK